VAILLVVFPCAYVATATGPLKNTLSILLAVFPSAKVTVAIVIGPLYKTVTIHLVEFKLNYQIIP
jgi:hypothetical protein